MADLIRHCCFQMGQWQFTVSDTTIETLMFCKAIHSIAQLIGPSYGQTLGRAFTFTFSHLADVLSKATYKGENSQATSNRDLV